MDRFPHGVSSYGIPLIGSGPILTTGKVYFVHYSTGTDAPGRGGDSKNPYKTLDYAIGRCQENKGDVIILMPGHAEDVIAAGTITADVAGVTIVGLGEGTLRPTFTFKTATTATILISAANVRISNVIFDQTGINAIATGVSVTAADVTIDNCKFICSAAAIFAAKSVVLGADADNFLLQNCEFASPVTAAVNCVYTASAVDNMRLIGNRFYGFWSGSAVLNDTAAATNVFISRNHFWMLHATGVPVTLHADATGMISHNNSYLTKDIAAGGTMAAASCAIFECYGVELAHKGTNGTLDPAAGGWA